MRCQPLQSCPSAFHWSSLTICCYPYILFGGTFRSPNALTLGYPFWLALVLEFFVLGLFLLFFYRYKNVLDHKNGELPPECTPNIDRLGEQSTNTYIRSANEKTVCLKCNMWLKFNVIFFGRKILCHGNYFV